MTVATKRQSIAHDALSVVTGLALLAFFYGLLACAFWLRWDAPIWGALS